LQGNVITGEKDLGYSLVTVTMALLGLSIFAITLLQRRFARWAN
jgi:Tfp pilus assembly protein PilX